MFKFANLILLFVVSGMMLPSTKVYANTSFQLKLGGGSEDNVTRGLQDNYQLRSNFFELGLSGGKLFQLGLNDSLSIGANISRMNFDDLSGFNRNAAGVSISYQHKLGFGAYATRLGASLSYDRESFRGEARDSDVSSLQLSYEKRFSPAWLIFAGIDFQQRKSDSLAPDPDVIAFGYDPVIRQPFELSEYDADSVFAELEYTFENGVLLSSSYRRVDGPTISSTTSPSLLVYKKSSAFYSDPALGSSWFAYLIDTKTDVWSLGVSVPIAQDSSVDLGYRWSDGRAAGGLNYQSDVLSITLIHNF